MCEDWAFAQMELLREQGFDVQKHMETKLCISGACVVVCGNVYWCGRRVSALEVRMRKEVDEAREQFEQEKKVGIATLLLP